MHHMFSKTHFISHNQKECFAAFLFPFVSFSSEFPPTFRLKMICSEKVTSKGSIEISEVELVENSKEELHGWMASLGLSSGPGILKH